MINHAYGLEVWRVQIVLIKDGKEVKYYTKWMEHKSYNQLRKEVLRKLEKSNWELVSIDHERPATYIWMPKPKRKKSYGNNR